MQEKAQKVFGNRWTEIAKVVPGRSDNAVKNRFSTLCKKRAKLDDQFKENRSPYINLNSKRTMFHNGCITSGASELTESLKKFRENRKINETFPMEHGNGEGHIRPPLAVLVQNLKNMDGCTTHHDISRSKAVMNDGRSSYHDFISDFDVLTNRLCLIKETGAINKDQSTFLRRDDPKITALIQQADFLSNLAIKVNSEDSNHSLENAWKELQDFLSQSGMNGSMRFEVDKMDFQFENFKDLMEELRSGDSESWLLKRQFDMHDESQVGSECNVTSIATENVTGNHNRDETSLDHYFDFTTDPIVEQCNKSGFSPNSGTEQALSSHDELIGKHGTVSCIEKTTLHCDLDMMMKPSPENDGGHCRDGFSTNSSTLRVLPIHDEQRGEDGTASALQNPEFTSPIHMTPLSRRAEAISSPKFSASERHFLLRALGMTSPLPNPNPNSIQQPSCKRALLHSL
ncbi:Myb-related protein 3R-1 [Acorus calamus]|uniref:Myb-related protein 3R-1 n=1 Tax=Acorus calamus TaxID=4465 RepID=A0AAV9E4W0_ACOCL|nr:Myb-related protein 3R-1 [Acorus calamus]